MASRSVLMLVQRSFRWPQSQFVKSSSLCLRCQSAVKKSQSAFCSLAPSDSSNFLLVRSFPEFSFQRNYAVKKSAKKSKGAKVSADVEGIDTNIMMKEMQSSVDVLKDEFAKALSLRSAGSVESLKVKYEGKEYELQKVAKLTRKGQQTIVVDMLSFPQMTKAVVDALKTSSLNLNPQQEGTTIYIPIPKVTKEHRDILAKKAKAIFITCRDKIKQIQEKNIKVLREEVAMGETEKQNAYKQVRAIAQKFELQAEDILKAKQDELRGEK